MKKFLSLFVLCILCISAYAQEKARLYVDVPRLLETGGKFTPLNIDVYLDNSISVNSFQVKMNLPKGVEPIDYLGFAELTNRVVNPFVNTAFDDSEDTKRPNYICAAAYPVSKLKPLSVTGNSGKVMTIKLIVDPREISCFSSIRFFDLVVGSSEVGQSICMPDVTIPLTIVDSSDALDVTGDKNVDAKDANFIAEQIVKNSSNSSIVNLISFIDYLKNLR